MDNQNSFLNVFMEVEIFFGSSVVKNPPERQEIWVQSLSQEDSPGEGNGNLTLIFLPGKSHGQRSLEVYSPWDLKYQAQLID